MHKEPSFIVQWIVTELGDLSASGRIDVDDVQDLHDEFATVDTSASDPMSFCSHAGFVVLHQFCPSRSAGGESAAAVRTSSTLWIRTLIVKAFELVDSVTPLPILLNLGPHTIPQPPHDEKSVQ